MRQFFIIIAGLFIINIIHADVSKKDLETLHTFIQEKKPLAEIEASDVWKKLKSPTEKDIQLIKERPQDREKQQEFFMFHNQKLMAIYRYIVNEIQTCEKNKDYDHEIDLLETLYSFVRLHFLDVGLQSGILILLKYAGRNYCNCLLINSPLLARNTVATNPKRSNFTFAHSSVPSFSSM